MDEKRDCLPGLKNPILGPLWVRWKFKYCDKKTICL